MLGQTDRPDIGEVPGQASCASEALKSAGRGPAHTANPLSSQEVLDNGPRSSERVVARQGADLPAL